MGFAVFLFSLAVFSLSWGYSLSEGFHNLRDGVSSVGAARVLAGELPYRDFWTMYAPGHFYLLALIFQVFGQSLWVEVVSASLVTAVSAGLVYAIGSRLTSSRLAALLPAVLFVAAHLNTGYFLRLGSYPTATLFIFISLLCLWDYFERNRRASLALAGLATGMAAWFKHDVAAYTALAIAIGIAVHSLSLARPLALSFKDLLRSTLLFGGVSSLTVLPVLVYFGLAAGADMLQNLVVFPLTDFPFSRPESYPGLIPRGIATGEALTTLENILKYFYFNIALALALAGILAVIFLGRRGRNRLLAPAVTLAAAFFLHFLAAHVQINTHIISLTLYAAYLGLILYDLTHGKAQQRNAPVLPLGVLVLTGAWVLMLAARPVYKSWEARRNQTETLDLAPVAGMHVSPQEAATFSQLKAIVDESLPSGGPLFVATHRNDVVVIGDVMIYFVLDRPSLTRYHELHPAITDTKPVQIEMIADLERQLTPLVITKQIFSDEILDQVKADFLRNLPQVGATDLDEYIHSHYVRAGQYGPYTVWRRAP